MANTPSNAATVRIELAPAVLNRREAVRYCGSETVFVALCERHGLTPLMRNRTRCWYSVAALDHAIRLLEHSGSNPTTN